MTLEFPLATPAEIARELGTRLKAARLGQGLRQDQLAQMAGVSRGMVTSLENRGIATLENFLRVASALGRVHEMQPLFAAPPLSIAQLEAASKPARQRAPRKTRHAADEASLASRPGQSLGLPGDRRAALRKAAERVHGSLAPEFRQFSADEIMAFLRADETPPKGAPAKRARRDRG